MTYFAGNCSWNVLAVFLLSAPTLTSGRCSASDRPLESMISGNFQQVTYATHIANASNRETDASNSIE